MMSHKKWVNKKELNMKNTRMMRHQKRVVQNKSSKYFYQVTTVVTLLCPMVLGSAGALAEEIAPVETTADTANVKTSTLPSSDPSPLEAPVTQKLEGEPTAPEVSVTEEVVPEVSVSESSTGQEPAVNEPAEQESITEDATADQAQGNEFEPDEETEENAAKVGMVNVILWCADNKSNTLYEETFQVPVNGSKSITAPEIPGYTAEYTFPAINDPHSMVTTDHQNKTYTVTPGGVEANETIRLQFNYRKIVPKNYTATFRTSEVEPYINSNGEGYYFTISDEEGWDVGSISCLFTDESSDEFSWSAWDYDHDYPVEGTGGRSGQPLIFEIGEAKYNITIIVDQRAPMTYSTISFAVEGNGTIPNATSIEKRNGYYLTYDELPKVAPAAGHRFVGWRTESQDWLSGFGLEIKQDTTLTAVFEAGELDWSKYDGFLARYKAYVDLKDIYDHFQWWDDWNAWNTIYQNYLGTRNRDDLSQKAIDSMADPLGGMSLNFVDHYFMYGVKIHDRIQVIFNSLESIYQDVDSYTITSKQVFDEKYLTLQSLLEQQERENGVYERQLFTAYQELTDARRSLVRNDGTKTLTSINLVPYPGLSFDGELAPFSNFMIQHGYSDGSHENLYLNKNDYVINTGNDQDVITEEGIIFNGEGRRDIEITYQGYKTGSGYSVLERENPAEDFTKAEEAMNHFKELKETDYTPESWKKMLQVLDDQAIGDTPVNEILQAIIDGTYPDEVSQSWLDWMTETLQTAMNELVKKDDGGNNGNNGSGNNNGSNNGNNSGSGNNGGTNNDNAGNNNNGTGGNNAGSGDNKGNSDKNDQTTDTLKNTGTGSTIEEVKTVSNFKQVNTQGTTETKGLPQTGEKGSFALTLVGMSTLGLALTGAFLKSRKKFD